MVNRIPHIEFASIDGIGNMYLVYFEL